jgi:serine/threonine-protein kinase RsbW
MSKDQITLCVPAKSEYARTVRMTAASIAGRMEMNYDDVDDVRMAAEEAFVYACDAAPASNDVTLHFSVEEGELGIAVPIKTSEHSANEDAERRSAYATFILQSVCDRFELSSDENGAWLRLAKRTTPVSEHAGT